MRAEAVEVLAQGELLSHIDEPHYNCLVSIGNPISLLSSNRGDTWMPEVFKKRFKKILRLSFYDVEEKAHLGKRQFPKIVPARRHVRRAISFFNKTSDSTNGYTMHCWAGVSRSTAFALGYLYMITGSEEEAMMILRNVRPQARPHQGIVKMFDDELGCNLTLVNDYLRREQVEKLKEELHISLDDLLEELQPVGNE